MPRYALPELPASVESVVEMFGASRVRVAVLLDLAEYPGSTRAEIADRLNLGRKLVLTTLQDLAQQGVVTDGSPSGRRPAHYTADTGAVRAAIDQLAQKFH